VPKETIVSGTLSSQDQSFLTTTSQDNLSEISDGRLAEQQSGNLATAIYGRQLVADHAFIAQQTNAAALQSGATVATTPDAMQQAQTVQLQPLTGATFDQQYLSNEIQSNAQSVTDGQTEAASGQSAVVKQFNALLVPFQAQHLLQAQILQASATGGTPPASTQPTGSPGLALAPNGALNTQDRTFIQQQASDNAAELQAGQFAETQGGDQAVKAYGRWLVLDHSVLNATLLPVAQTGGVTPTTTPDPMAAAMNATLKGLTGTAFDMQYLSDEIMSNVQGINYLEQEINNGADPALVALAQAALPLQEQHLAGAVEASTVLGAGTSDQNGAPSTAAGQTAAALGNAVAQAAVANGQQLATAGSNNSSSGSALFPATPGAGSSGLGALTAPAGSATPTSGFVVTDATGKSSTVAGSAYSGPVNYLQTQYIYGGSAGVNITAESGNVFLKGGAGNDALLASSGSNVLDGGAGSNFLVGASGGDGGTDTFFVDGRSGGQSTWDTLVNFHVGDTLLLLGYDSATGKTSFADNQGAAGYQGATLNANFGGSTGSSALVTFAGLTTGATHLATSTGTSGGVSYLAVTRTA